MLAAELLPAGAGCLAAFSMGGCGCLVVMAMMATSLVTGAFFAEGAFFLDLAFLGAGWRLAEARFVSAYRLAFPSRRTRTLYGTMLLL